MTFPYSSYPNPGGSPERKGAVQNHQNPGMMAEHPLPAGMLDQGTEALLRQEIVKQSNSAAPKTTQVMTLNHTKEAVAAPASNAFVFIDGQVMPANQDVFDFAKYAKSVSIDQLSGPLTDAMANQPAYAAPVPQAPMVQTMQMPPQAPMAQGMAAQQAPMTQAMPTPQPPIAQSMAMPQTPVSEAAPPSQTAVVWPEHMPVMEPAPMPTPQPVPTAPQMATYEDPRIPSPPQDGMEHMLVAGKNGFSYAPLVLGSTPSTPGMFTPWEYGLIGWSFDPMTEQILLPLEHNCLYTTKIHWKLPLPLTGLRIGVTHWNEEAEDTRLHLGIYQEDGTLLYRGENDLKAGALGAFEFDEALELAQGRYVISIMVTGQDACQFIGMAIGSHLSNMLLREPLYTVSPTSDHQQMPDVLPSGMQPHPYSIWAGFK